MIAFLDRLRPAQRVLIVGCGGGFDVFSGVPIAVHLKAQGSSVFYANLSFSNLSDSGGERIGPTTWLVEPGSNELPYFPEKWLAEWLARRDDPAPVYGLMKSGVEPLQAAIRGLVDRHAIDLVLLVDGGTDSLIFGDEPGLGTVVEDAVSVVAAVRAVGQHALLLALGFGVDHFHGVSHHAFLENVARLSRTKGYLGSCSLTQGNPEADAFLDLVDYANQRQPAHRSIVCNSIASALRGEFGDFHATDRTVGAELFISPLMSQYWAFEAAQVVASMKFSRALSTTQSFSDAIAVIESERQGLVLRPRRPIPL